MVSAQIIGVLWTLGLNRTPGRWRPRLASRCGAWPRTLPSCQGFCRVTAPEERPCSDWDREGRAAVWPTETQRGVRGRCLGAPLRSDKSEPQPESRRFQCIARATPITTNPKVRSIVRKPRLRNVREWGSVSQSGRAKTSQSALTSGLTSRMPKTTRITRSGALQRRFGRNAACSGSGRDAIFIAPPAPYVRLSRIRLPSRVCDGKLSVCGPAPVTPLPGSVSGACFAGPHSPWSAPLAPPTPLRPPPQMPPQWASFVLFAGFTATMAGSDFSCPCFIGFGSSPSRCGPSLSRNA